MKWNLEVFCLIQCGNSHLEQYRTKPSSRLRRFLDLGGYFNNPYLSYVQSYTNTNKMDLYQYKKKKGLNVAYF